MTEVVPTTGRDLLAWADEHDRRHGTELRWKLTLWGSRLTPARSVARWDAGRVAAGWRMVGIWKGAGR